MTKASEADAPIIAADEFSLGHGRARLRTALTYCTWCPALGSYQAEPHAGYGKATPA